MPKTLYILVLSLVVSIAAGCSNNQAATGGSNQATAENTTQPGPDNSEITTKVDSTGVKTQERVFHGNPRIARVVVTTHNGNRSVKAYSPKGEEREINDKNEVEQVLSATGDKVASAAGFAADKSEDVAGEAKDVGTAAKDKTVAVGEKTAEVAKDVGDKTAEGAKTVKDKTVEGAKTVGSKTVSGTKKVGRAVKKIIP
jgi:hypothetical protein